MNTAEQKGYRKDITGKRFGRLVVKQFTGRRYVWECQCDCGKIKTVWLHNLITGRTVSCGCYQHECQKKNSRTHGCTTGGKRMSEYNIWRAMRDRCSNKDGVFWHRYGGRGITVCDRWNDFANFLQDMGRRPSSKHSIDRIDNNKGYSPENCRWATIKEQSNNTCRNVRIAFDGQELSASEWSKRTGISRAAIARRYRIGWRGADLFKPLRKTVRRKPSATTQSCDQAA